MRIYTVDVWTKNIHVMCHVHSRESRRYAPFHTRSQRERSVYVYQTGACRQPKKNKDNEIMIALCDTHARQEMHKAIKLTLIFVM